jgi:hypothetical protein
MDQWSRESVLLQANVPLAGRSAVDALDEWPIGVAPLSTSSGRQPVENALIDQE